MHNEPLVSIITPVFNRSSTLNDNIKSVLSQTYSNWEMILVDDCSKDDSVEIIEGFLRSDARIKLIKLTENSGAAVARNRAIEAAKGRFIAFLDSDDLWKASKLQTQVDFALKTKVALTHTAYEWMDGAGDPMGKIIKSPSRLDYKAMLKSNYIGCLTAMYDVEIIGEKVYMPEVAKRQDYALWLKILRAGHTARFIDEPLAYYRVGHDSLSSNKMETILYYYKILREIEGIGRVKSAYYFTIYLINAFRKFYLK
jgi:teichuronic acid biosynthesis glycosyltransferase TuaG